MEEIKVNGVDAVREDVVDAVVAETIVEMAEEEAAVAVVASTEVHRKMTKASSR